MQYFKRLLKKIFKFIQPIGRFFGRFLSPLSLLLVYFFIVIPTGVFLKLLNKDVLNIKIDKKKDTYWISREEDPNFEEQF
tara:strand:- start:447 stop:686 length:240 start_codon:yes stop_codon:yes gene_type:complete